ncbi:transmembrane protein, putative [Medicago truncatula]|uniref:Transmembrane protein, putative n=1 Tax=Medicago truncatula TaxID=3880 RepID=G7IIZ9_MEDTR|nr:transmembrane protein, putative [Medicago truncatula]
MVKFLLILFIIFVSVITRCSSTAITPSSSLNSTEESPLLTWLAPSMLTLPFIYVLTLTLMAVMNLKNLAWFISNVDSLPPIEDKKEKENEAQEKQILMVAQENKDSQDQRSEIKVHYSFNFFSFLNCLARNVIEYI